MKYVINNVIRLLKSSKKKTKTSSVKNIEATILKKICVI